MEAHIGNTESRLPTVEAKLVPIRLSCRSTSSLNLKKFECQFYNFYKIFMLLSTVFIKARIAHPKTSKVATSHISFFTHVEPLKWS